MNKKIIILVIIVLLFGVVFFLGRNSVEKKPQYIETDVSKWVKKVDSLEEALAARSVHEAKLQTKIDSLKSKIGTNNIKIQHEVKTIKHFTPDAREHWNDSVLKSARLR